MPAFQKKKFFFRNSLIMTQISRKPSRDVSDAIDIMKTFVSKSNSLTITITIVQNIFMFILFFFSIQTQHTFGGCCCCAQPLILQKSVSHLRCPLLSLETNRNVSRQISLLKKCTSEIDFPLGKLKSGDKYCDNKVEAT